MARFILLVIGLLVFVASYGVAVDRPMLVYLSFDEADPDDFKDRSPNQYDITVQGGKSVEGKFGRAFRLDGMQDFVEIANDDNLNPTEEFTVETWVYVEEESGGWSALVGKNPFTVGYLIWLRATGVDVAGLVWVAETRYDVDSNVDILEGNWYHLCYTAKQGEMNIYVDGELTGTKAIPDGEFGTNTNALRIGGQGSAGFIGIIDEVAVYSVELTLEEIRQDMENTPVTLAVQSSGKLTTIWGGIKSKN